MWILAARNLWTRPTRTLFTLLAIALGVGMIFAMRIVSVAVATAAAQARSSHLAGADLEVAGAHPGAISARLALTLTAQPDVAAAAPIYRRLEGEIDPHAPLDPFGLSVQLRGTGLALLGVDPANTLTPYQVTAGRFFSGPAAHEILLPAVWAAQQGRVPGDRITLYTGDQRGDWMVVGLLARDPAAAPGSRPVAWVPLVAMQTAFTVPDAASAVLVRLRDPAAPTAARDRLQARLGVPYVVSSADGAGADARQFINTLNDAALPFAGIAVLLSGAFLVYNAFAITLTERRREIGQLRTLGMTRRQVLRLTLLEALFVALLGGGVGLLLGAGLGQALMVVFVQLLKNQPVPPITLPLDGALLGLVAGVGVTLAVTYNLARRAGQVSPLDSLRQDPEQIAGPDRSVRWAVIGTAGGLALFAICFWLTFRSDLADGFTYVLLAPLSLALAVLGMLPLGVRLALAGFVRLAARSGPTARIGARNLARSRRQATLTAATMTISLLLVVALSGISVMFIAFEKRAILNVFEGDYLVVRVPPAGYSFEDQLSAPAPPPMPPALQADLDALAAEAVVHRMGQFHLPEYAANPTIDNAFALDLATLRDNPSFHLREGSWDQASAWFAAGPALGLPEFVARRYGIHPGDMVQVSTVEGRVPFRVAFTGGVLPVVNVETGQRYFNTHPQFFFISARVGHDKAALDTRLRDLGRTYRLFVAADPQQSLTNTMESVFDQMLGLFIGLTALSGLVGGLGIINTLLAGVLERQREIGMLRAVGMTRSGVRRLVVVEAGLLGLTGAGIGAAGGLLIAFTSNWVMDTLLVNMLGYGLGDFTLPWGVAAAALVAGPIMAMLAALEL